MGAVKWTVCVTFVVRPKFVPVVACYSEEATTTGSELDTSQEHLPVQDSNPCLEREKPQC